MYTCEHHCVTSHVTCERIRVNITMLQTQTGGVETGGVKTRGVEADGVETGG